MEKFNRKTAQKEYENRYKENNDYEITMEGDKVVIEFNCSSPIVLFDGKKWLTEDELHIKFNYLTNKIA